jgi:hypothetical protein
MNEEHLKWETIKQLRIERDRALADGNLERARALSDQIFDLGRRATE